MHYSEGFKFSEIQNLNFALILEQFHYAFYSHALSIFSDDDFKNAGYPSWVRGRFQQILDNERVHKDFLQSAIAAAGSEHVQPANYDLWVTFNMLLLSC